MLNYRSLFRVSFIPVLLLLLASGCQREKLPIRPDASFPMSPRSPRAYLCAIRVRIAEGGVEGHLDNALQNSSR
jgi:hypothetical protein